MDEETWKTIPLFHGIYEVSNLGGIRRSGNKAKRKTPTGKRGYPVFSVRGWMFDPPKSPDRSFPVYVHTCVALAFLPNGSNLPQVNHKDGNKENNCVENLEWCSAKQNLLHARKTGLHKSDGDKAVLQIKDGVVVAEYKSASRASRETGICRTTICNVANHRVCNGRHNYSAGGYQWEWK